MSSFQVVWSVKTDSVVVRGTSGEGELGSNQRFVPGVAKTSYVNTSLVYLSFFCRMVIKGEPQGKGRELERKSSWNERNSTD